MPPSFDLTAVVTLVLVPVVAAVTVTPIVQVPFAAILPPDRPIAVDPAANPERVPPQVFVTAGIEATIVPAGNASLNPTPVRVTRGFD